MRQFEWLENPVRRYGQYQTEAEKIRDLFIRGYTKQDGFCEMMSCMFRDYISYNVKSQKQLDDIVNCGGPCRGCDICDHDCSMYAIITEVREGLPATVPEDEEEEKWEAVF